MTAGTLRPGRPRIADLDERVCEATVALLLDCDDSADVTIASIVRRSGVSRAAIYRRWGSREELIAAALDTARAEVVVPDSGSLLDDVIMAYTYDPDSHKPGFHRLMRKRLIMAIQYPDVQLAYWRSHVSRRRVPVAQALHRGVERGELRSDLDVDAAIDLIAGMHYYQMVVRGADVAHPETQQRIHSAIRLVWQGMTAADTGCDTPVPAED